MLIPNDWAQANIIFGGNGVPLGAQITFGMSVELFTGDAADAAQEVLDQFNTSNIMGNVSDEVEVRGCLVKFGPNATGQSAEVAGTDTGQITGESVAPNTAFLIRKLTGVGGRTGRGRLFLPGVAESAVGPGGALTSTYAVDISATFNAFQLNMATAGLPLALLHSPDSPVSTPMLITSLSCDTRVATQRRRLRR
jgi:hypothetical protein